MKSLWCATILFAALSQAGSGQAPLVLKETIDLPRVEGRIDHLAFDAPRQQMFVAALGNNTVEVLDLAKGVHARSLPGFHEPQGIAFLSDSNLIAVANGQSGDLVLLDARAGSVKRSIPLSEDADNVRYDADAKRVYVAHGSGAMSAVDTGHVATAAGARTSLYVPQQNRLYLAVPHRGAQRTEVRVYDIAP